MTVLPQAAYSVIHVDDAQPGQQIVKYMSWKNVQA